MDRDTAILSLLAIYAYSITKTVEEGQAVLGALRNRNLSLAETATSLEAWTPLVPVEPDIRFIRILLYAERVFAELPLEKGVTEWSVGKPFSDSATRQRAGDLYFADKGRFNNKEFNYGTP